MNNKDNTNDEENKINIFHKLRDKKSASIISQLLNFINNQIDDILKNENINNIPIIIQDFISHLTLEFIKQWNLEQNINRPIYYIEIIEGFESLITKSIYPKLMNLYQDDLAFDKLCKKFSFITLKHLDLDVFIDEFELAKQFKNLTDINDYKGPKEKSVLLVNFYNYLSYSFPKLERDNFIKLLAYTILKANITNLKINVKFIQAFRHKTTISCEESYYLLQINKAFSFIQQLEDDGNKGLNMNKKEYITLVEESEKKDPFLLKKCNIN
jgi:hypothetical protein